MARPEYKLSTPNTGSYQLAPQAAPVSTYVRPKQLDPNLTDFKTQAATFQNFVESMTEWRVAENKDNQEKAQLRALADNALGNWMPILREKMMIIESLECTSRVRIMLKK